MFDLRRSFQFASADETRPRRSPAFVLPITFRASPGKLRLEQHHPELGSPSPMKERPLSGKRPHTGPKSLVGN